MRGERPSLCALGSVCGRRFTRQFRIDVFEEGEDERAVARASVQIDAEGQLILVGTHGELEIGLVLDRAAQIGVGRAQIAEGQARCVQHADIGHTDEWVLEAGPQPAVGDPVAAEPVEQVELDKGVEADIGALSLPSISALTRPSVPGNASSGERLEL